MIKLEKPQLEVSEVVDVLINSMRNSNNRKESIKKYRNELIEFENKYDELGSKQQLYILNSNDLNKNEEKKNDLIYLYEEKLVKSKEGRKYYNQIKANTKFDKCPYCGHERVETLDHYLPKSNYPIFSITPLNLIPACFNCNHNKLDEDINRYDEMIIHPYYDDFSKIEWLKAEVIPNEEPSFFFSVAKTEKLITEDYNRLVHHFEVFKLAELYSANASREFQNKKKYFKEKLLFYGNEEFIKDIKSEIESRKEKETNTWEIAMLEAIINSQWLLEEYLKS